MVENTSNSGRRPTLSESAPMIGRKHKFEIPTQSVTSMLDLAVRWSTLPPYVGMYAVIR